MYENEIDAVKYVAHDGSGVKTVALSEVPAADGTLVEVYARSGTFLGTGVLNRASKIAVRLVGAVHADVIMEDVSAYWSKKVRDAVNVRRLQFSDTESCRLVFGESDGIPGFIAERYVEYQSGNVYLVVQFLACACEVFRKELLGALKAACRPFGVYERSDAAVREKEGLSKTAGWIGPERNDVIIIEENGLKLCVDIARGQKTGYFLDQKYNRLELRRFCHGKRVLDAFSHTGSFGLNAAAGGAREVVCVESSEEAVAQIRQNCALNHVRETLSVRCADVFDVLKEYETNGEKFDVIVLDPPAFTKSAKQVQKAYGGYKEINLRAMRLLNEGGILVTCSCSYFFDANTFYSMLMHAAMDSHCRVQVLQKRGAAPDHPVLLGYPQSEYLCCAVCRVTGRLPTDKRTS